MNAQLTLSQAIQGYLLDANARRMSPRTIETYVGILRRFQEFTGDPALASIQPNHIRRFLAHVAESPIGHGPIARPGRTPSDKTILNYYTALSALWTWCLAENLVDTHVVQAVSRPEPESRAIHPFTEADVRALLSVVDRSSRYTRPGKRECNHARPSADRDRMLILLLIDTGIRASELCISPRRRAGGLHVGDVDLENQRIKVFGKGSKERFVPISPRTAKAIWRYLLDRPDAQADEFLIIGREGIPLTTSGLYQLIKRIGERAGVPGAHPHRFRHTFAVNFLRNGGNIYALQNILGHSTLEMVRRYVELAEADVQNAHRRASVVTNWNL